MNQLFPLCSTAGTGISTDRERERERQKKQVTSPSSERARVKERRRSDELGQRGRRRQLQNLVKKQRVPVWDPNPLAHNVCAGEKVVTNLSGCHLRME